MELFPTNVRQSGIGFATLISQTISIGGPYTIYLGQYDLKLPYVIMFLSQFFLWILLSHLTQSVSHESTVFTFGKTKGFPKMTIVYTQGDLQFNWSLKLYLHFFKFVSVANEIELGMFMSTNSFNASADRSSLFKNTPKFYHIDIIV